MTNRSYQIPGGPRIVETGVRSYQIPGGPRISDTVILYGLFYVIYPAEFSAPSATQIKNRLTAAGGLATAYGSEYVEEYDDVRTFGIDASGLTADTSYRIAYVWSDGTYDSNVVVSEPFITNSLPIVAGRFNFFFFFD